MSTASVRRISLRWALILLIAAVCLFITGIMMLRLPRPNRNMLAIGSTAASTELAIPIRPPAELDYLSKAEVLRMRTEAVQQYPDLLQGQYRPSDAVFGQIEDGRPWWGVKGNFYYGSGEKSIEGPAEESRFILNPYLLVAAEFHAPIIWSNWELGWDKARISESDLNRADFPYTCRPHSLHWWPRESRAEVSYDVSGCFAAMSRWGVTSLGIQNASFDLFAYNARDLNLGYIYVSYADSPNVTKAEAPANPIAIPHFIHRGGSCGYPGGCNNMSPFVPELDGLQLTALPAEAVMWLWRQAPASSHQPPDMVFVIHFR